MWTHLKLFRAAAGYVVLNMLMLFFGASTVQAQTNGFGTCAAVGNLAKVASVRNDARLGSWVNRNRSGSSWDFSNLVGDGGSAALYWWSFDRFGIPEFYLGSNFSPAPNASGWSADLFRITKIGSNASVSSVVGNVNLSFKPGNNEKRMEVTWLLFGSTSAAAVAGRVSVPAHRKINLKPNA